MGKVGICNTLEKDGMDNFQAYIFWQPLCSAAVAFLLLLLTAQQFGGMADLIDSIKGSPFCLKTHGKK